MGDIVIFFSLISKISLEIFPDVETIMLLEGKLFNIISSDFSRDIKSSCRVDDEEEDE